MSSRRAEPQRTPGRERRACRAWIALLGLAFALAACGGGADGGNPGGEDPRDPPSVVDVRALLRIPAHMELPAIPHFNPITRAKIDLGRKLFHDTRLSANRTQSCASCHDQSRAFSDGKRTPTGSTGDVLERNSMGLANVAYLSTLTWASNTLRTLEDQIEIPILSDDPVELGVTDGVRDEVLARFDADSEYAAMFAEAFPESTGPTTVNEVIFALASFCRSLISGGSPYDRFLAGDDTALTEQQKRGFALFNGEKFECFHCHTGVLLTTAYRDENTDPENIRTPFFNDGLYDVDGTGGYPPQDQGLYDLTLDPDDRGLFRPASLRNVALTAPYMHDGSIATLRDVLRHYAAGGRNVTSGPFAGDGRLSPLKSGLLRGFAASDEEIDAVLAFLESLSDPGFLTDPAFADPRP